jgi:hypothetical protein
MENQAHFFPEFAPFLRKQGKRITATNPPLMDFTEKFPSPPMKTPASHKSLAAVLAFLGFSVAPSWATVTGRYVRLEIPEIPSFGSNKYAMSHMAEIEVHSGGKNVALQSTPSSSAGNKSMNELINGSRDWLLGDFGTGKQVNPWIELDLGAAVPVDSVLIFTKKGADRDEPLMWVVSVLDEQRNLAWYQRTDIGGNSHPNTFRPAPMQGRFIGQSLPPGAGAWYRVDQEQSQERNFQLLPFEVPPLPDAKRRIAIFSQRESNAEIERLCKQLHAAVQPDHPSLETFKARFDAGDFSGALTAYRDLFFDRLANPEKHGIPKEIANCVGGLGKRTPVIHSLIAEEAMRNRRVSEIRGKHFSAPRDDTARASCGNGAKANSYHFSPGRIPEIHGVCGGNNVEAVLAPRFSDSGGGEHP